MFDIQVEEMDWGGQRLRLETGRIARQADGAVLATLGETTVLATVVSEKSARSGIDFFPLTVHYQEKTYASGKIPGGYFKREGRPTERETLVSRLIDRPIRPLFAEGYNNETQVVVTVLSHDQVNDPDILAIVAASAALTLSGVPFMGPLGGARVGFIDGDYVLNPSVEEQKRSDLDLIVAGTSEAVLMVESEAKNLSEEVMLKAVMFGHAQFQCVIDAIIRLAERAARPPRALESLSEELHALAEKVSLFVKDDLSLAYKVSSKEARQDRVSELKKKVLDHFVSDVFSDQQVSGIFKSLEKKIVRGDIIELGKRIDGRGLRDIRPIRCEVGVLPRTHGSALFTRGETQALVVATLGTGDDEQMIDSLLGTYKESFLLHYNFPPYSVGEVGRMGGAGRREIGHGKLAWRAIHPVLPEKEAFPYTLRIVSEITESNGSSSMATVCGASLALMDAGVPVKEPVAGIAMGLILDGKRFAVLTDILGDEDYLGDMDFKVAGGHSGITALQMDIKVQGITEEIMQQALLQAREGRLHILSQMALALEQSRPTLGEHAPRIETITIPVDKIRDVIGSGGRVIREIVEKTGAKIDISDDGMIKIASGSAPSIEAAMQWIRSIVSEPEVGMIYDGSVVKIVDFGAFVNFMGNRDGLVHISELTDARVNKVTDILKEGDRVKVKLLGIDPKGKVRLSMRVVDQETGQDLTA